MNYMKKTKIIAEIGVNHNGRIDMAKKLIEKAKECGADYVKFQTFKAEKLVAQNTALANYQKSTAAANIDQLKLLKELELTFDEFLELKEFSDDLSISFLSTAFDSESFEFIASLDLEMLKIPSGEITNLPFIYEHAKTKKDLIISTGMANLDEIRKALLAVVYGFKNIKPSSSQMEEKVLEQEDTIKKLKEKITLLHCTSEYPAPLDEVNLNAIKNLAPPFELNYGYSDHTDGISVSIAAAALGAKIIEKHFTLDKKEQGPDHMASTEPDLFKEMVKHIREIDQALGSNLKKPTLSEIRNKDIVRKSLFAELEINKGEIFTKNNIIIKRPGTGMNPEKIWDLIGMKSKKTYKKNEIIDE